MTDADNFTPSSKKYLAKRVKFLRSKTKLSRRAFAIKYNISPSLLQHWENGDEDGLNEKSARKLIEAFTREGVKCTSEWLLFGHDYAPKAIEPTESNDQYIDEISSQLFTDGIVQELSLFHKLYPDTVDIVVTDNCMLPKYHVGDHVAGRRYYSEDLQKTIGSDCIVLTEKGDLFIRTIKQISKEGKFCLVCLNPENRGRNAVETNILFAAPIIWIRRKCPISTTY